MAWFDRIAALLIAGLVAYLVAQPPLRGVEGPAFDLLLLARQEISSPGRRPLPPVVVVGLDRETALRPPFDHLPQQLWTPQVATVMAEVLKGGAQLVAQQQAFTASINGTIADYDNDYTRLIHRAAADGRFVLGRRAPAADRAGPVPAHVDAIGGDRNLRRVGIFADPDGVVRHVRLYNSVRDLTGSVSLQPTLALELAARVAGRRPQLLVGSALELGRYTVPGSRDNKLLLNFLGGSGGIPVFSLADLHACAQDGEEAFFRKHFDDKIVLFGSIDDPASRRPSAARFLGQNNADRAAPRCRLTPMESLEAVDSSYNLPDVLITATAVRNLLQRDAVKTLPPLAAVAISALLALALALAMVVLRIAPRVVALATLVLLAGWSYLAVIMLAQEAWLMPLAQPALALVLSFILAYVYLRIRDRRRTAAS